MSVAAIWLAATYGVSLRAQPAPHPADAAFMAGMIAHHAQALVMVDLLPGRSRNPTMATLGERIAVSQRDEIAMMQRWLQDHGQPVPAPSTHWRAGVGQDHTMHAGHDAATMPGMPGMLTADQLNELAAAKGSTFDRLFLTRMIAHHEGALVMVAALLKTSGAAQDPEVFRFASDVDADQRAEIRRMRAMLDRATPSPAPRRRVAAP